MTQRILFGLLALLPGLAVAQPAKPARATAATYFQQQVNYSIDVALDDKSHQLTGRARAGLRRQ